MNLPWWQGLLLGLVQGLTEFLPVSSSGHLVLAERLLGVHSPGVFLEVSLHVATLLAVFVAYRERIAELVRGLVARDAMAWRYAGLVLLASVPAAVAGLGFKKVLEDSFQGGVSIGVQFLITAAVLWATRSAMARATKTAISPAAALVIGVAQAIAIVPAISRSGFTIAAALLFGIAPGPAAEFSFLMSIVAIGGSGLLEARHVPPGVNLLDPGFLIAFAAALVSGVFAIRWLITLVRDRQFHRFAPYCAVVGVFTIWLFW